MSNKASNLYEVSPRLKALEADAPAVPADLSYDYKREARAHKAAKCEQRAHENPKDFKQSDIHVLSPDELIVKVKGKG